MNQMVGLVGFGAIGSIFAEQLRTAGCRVLVFDVDPGAMERARAAGFEVADSPAGIAERCGIIDLIVRTDADVLAAVAGPRGIAERAQRGSTVIVHSTVSLPTTFQVAEVMQSRGAGLFDACPTEMPAGLRAGDNIFLAGGDTGLVERLRPHLLHMAKDVLHLGPLGAGNVAKMVKNLVIASERLIVREALLLGEAAGLHYLQALEMLRATSFGSGAPLAENWESAFDPAGAGPTLKPTSNLFQKDVPLAAELGRSHGLDLPVIFELERAGLAAAAAAQPGGNRR